MTLVVPLGRSYIVSSLKRKFSMCIVKYENSHIYQVIFALYSQGQYILFSVTLSHNCDPAHMSEVDDS